MNITADTNIVITGASSGLGKALAIACGVKGATVVLVARRSDELELVAQAVREAGGTAHVIVADVSVEEHCINVIDQSLSLLGKVDVLINNAGRGNCASLEDTTSAQWHSIFSVNVDSVFYLTARILPHMKKNNSGCIVAISSVGGRYGHPYNAAYVAAKHAVVGLIAALRTELVGTGVNATCICPAGIITDWADVTEGGSIGSLYTTAIPRSRTIARDLGISTAPLSKMMSAETCANIILNAVESGHTSDVFTHEGTHAIAVEAVSDRVAQENRFEALWKAMAEAYNQALL